MDKRQRDHDWSGPGSFLTEQQINHVAKEAREQELERVEELSRDIRELMLDDVLEVGSDSWTKVVQKIGELKKIAISSIKAK